MNVKGCFGKWPEEQLVDIVHDLLRAIADATGENQCFPRPSSLRDFMSLARAQGWDQSTTS